MVRQHESSCKRIGLLAVSCYLFAWLLVMVSEDSTHLTKQLKKAAARQRFKGARIDVLNQALSGPRREGRCKYVRDQPEAAGIDETAAGATLISPQEFKALLADKKIGEIETEAPSALAPIPKVMHQTTFARHLEGDTEMYFASSWLRCLPHWYHVLWDDDEIRELFEQNRPDLLPLYDSYSFPVQKADMFRYIVMQVYGGLYADLDYECIVHPRLHPLIQELAAAPEKAFIVEGPTPDTDGELQNTLMASAPGHSFWTHTLHTASAGCGRYWAPEFFTYFGRATGICWPIWTIRNFVSDPGWCSVLHTTGPRMLSASLATASPATKAVIRILPAELFNGQGSDCAPYMIHHSDPRFDSSIDASHWDKASNVPHPYTGSIDGYSRLPFHRIWVVLGVEFWTAVACVHLCRGLIPCRKRWASSCLVLDW